MRVVVIGGTGHIGSYLTPRLVMAGADVVSVSRGARKPYVEHGAWRSVTEVVLDRDAEEAAGNFGQQIAALGADAVIDITCYTPESAVQMADALRGNVQHLLHCGTVWVHGHSTEVPTPETAKREPFGDYGIRKAAIEAYYLREARSNSLPVTLLHPGHIVGSGWNPLNPQGNFNPEVFSTLLHGRELTLPNIGMETVHHVHADDVAQSFVCALQRRAASVGESFHVVSPTALTLRGYAEKTATLLGSTAKLKFRPFDEWKTTVSEKDARSTWDHIAHSPNCSIAKAQRLLGYQPRYTSMEAVAEALNVMRANGTLA
ncbi:MAG: NAD-dependent epimerase/dehydratase family protein [Janthinobacterium lividum]